MTRLAWLTPFLGRLVDEGIRHNEERLTGFAPARTILVEHDITFDLARQFLKLEDTPERGDE